MTRLRRKRLYVRELPPVGSMERWLLEEGLRNGTGADRFDVDGLRAAWETLGPEINRDWRYAGHRPWGWWQFEATRPRNETFDEVEQLAEMKQLRRGEREAWNRYPDRPWCLEK